METIRGPRSTKYRQAVSHAGLHKHRIFTSPYPSDVTYKVRMQIAEWAEQWEVRTEKDAARQARQDAKDAVEFRKEEAADRTTEAKAALEELDAVLANRNALPEGRIWESVVGEREFTEAPPQKLPTPHKPGNPVQPIQPSDKVPPYKFSAGFLDYLIPGRMAKSRAKAAEKFKLAHEAWTREMATWRARNAAADSAYEAVVASVASEQACLAAEWAARKAEFDEKVAGKLRFVAEQSAAYKRHEASGVEIYIDAMLACSSYPECFSPSWTLSYQPEGKLLTVDYDMPAPDALPRLKEVKYVVSRDEDTESFITDAQASKMYDSVLYQTALRAIFEVFIADNARAIDTICLNGIVTSASPATGNEVTACLLSVQVNRDVFMEINLDAVDPKECFRKLRGVASSKLSGMAAVVPLQRMNREDVRFIEGRSVIDGVDEGMNVAAMPWDDFEHLIRELFEREFSSNGSEVRVTRASRDAGVDAVIFDPDPLRGGKIIIQAKRYTNTVDVSAVRDLFGTVHNEGAIKGILVTTSTFGPDSYAFAADKPLTLIDGGRLLFLLQKNGTKARIDIREAKQLAGRSDG